MKRLTLVLPLCALTALATACGGGATPAPDAGSSLPDIESFFPASAAVTGWDVDAEESPNGVEKYTTKEEVDATSIDGDVTPYQNKGFTAVGRQFYTNGTYTGELRVWQMKDGAAAAAVYDSVLTDPPSTHYKDIIFSDIAIGTKGRSGFQYPKWYINSYKGLYFVEARVFPSTIGDTGCVDASRPLVEFAIGKVP